MTLSARHWTGGALWMTASSAVVGVLGLLAVTAAARGLGASQYGEFAVTWALFFGVGGLFAGLQSETTRSLSSERPVGPGGSRLVRSAGLLALPVAVVGGFLAVAAADGGGRAVSGGSIFLGLLMLAGLTVVSGVLAAGLHWRGLAGLMALDAGIRTVAVVSVSRAGAAEWMPMAIVSGALAWLLLLPGIGRQEVLGETEGSPAGYASRAALAMAAAGCTSVVVSGLPALLALVRPDAVDGSVAGLLAALVLIRSGLLIVVYGLRPVILRLLLSAPVNRAVILKAVGCCVGVGAGYTCLVGVFGSAALQWVLGDEFTLESAAAFGLAVGSTGLVVMVVLGLALLALDEHAAAVAGWTLALATTVILLASVPATTSAVLLAASVAPWVGAAAHLLISLRATRPPVGEAALS